MENDPLLCFTNLFELFKSIKKWYYTVKKVYMISHQTPSIIVSPIDYIVLDGLL